MSETFDQRTELAADIDWENHDPEWMLRSAIRYNTARHGCNSTDFLLRTALRQFLQECYIVEYARRLQAITPPPPLR